MGAQDDIQAAFDALGWGQKLINKKKRAALSDFGRFQVSIAKTKRNKEIAKKVAAAMK
jgi:hypothetical protein